MANHKNLKKVIAVSSMAAATMGAGTIVNADNVHQQPVSSQKSSISTKVSTESQSVKSSSRVVLKSSKSSSTKVSSQSSVKKTTSIASSSSKVSTKASSISAKKAQPMNLAAVQQGKMTSDVKSTTDPLMNDFNKWNNSSDSDLSYDANDAKTAYDSINQIAKQYDEGAYANKSDRDYIIKDVANSLKNAKSDYDMSKTLSDIPNLKEKQQIYKDVYEAWNNLYNLLTNGEPAQTSSQSSSSAKSSSKKNDTKASSISKANSKKDSAKKSSKSSKKVSSQNSNKNAADAVSAIETLQDTANKYQNSSDATTQSYAQEAQQWLSNLGTFMNAQKNGWNSQKEIDNEINALKNDIKSNEDTLNASWFHGNDATKEIIKDQINADKAMLTYLTGNAQETPATKNDAEATSSKKADQKVAAKNTTSAKKSVSKVNKTVSSKSLHETHVVSAATKNAAKNTTSTKANTATKKSKLPQTGETNNIGVLAGISVLAIAAAGAFLFRKRG